MSFEHISNYLIRVDKLLAVERWPGEDEGDAKWVLKFDGGTLVKLWEYPDPDSFKAFGEWLNSHPQWNELNVTEVEIPEEK